MATDSGASILTAAGKLRKTAVDIFRALPTADGGVSWSSLMSILEDFGFEADERCKQLVDACQPQDGEIVSEASFVGACCAAFHVSEAEGIDLTDASFRAYYNHAGEILSNFYMCPQLSVDGLEYPTVEHFYQSSKHLTTSPDLAERIRLAPTIDDAHLLGGNAAAVRPDWDAEREGVYLKGMLAKFTQNAVLREHLLATGNKTLVQVDSDRFWGCCVPDDTPGGSAVGNNAGGKALMQVRSSLRAHPCASE